MMVDKMLNLFKKVFKNIFGKYAAAQQVLTFYICTSHEQFYEVVFFFMYVVKHLKSRQELQIRGNMYFHLFL
jgi:hypothetical protein